MRGWTPAMLIRGELRPPGSKSIAQRALLAAALVRDTGSASELSGLPDGDDVRAALALARGLGAELSEQTAGRVRVRGVGPQGCMPGEALDAGESGTLARLATAVLALHSRTPVRLAARGTLRSRWSPPLYRALELAGAGLEPEGPGGWPVVITPVRDERDLELDGPISSQEVSALLLAAAARAGPTTVRVNGPVPSAPYLDLTRDVLARFGARLEGGVPETSVHGPLVPGELVIEPDASSAAVALAAACLSGGELRVSGLGAESVQGDVRIVQHLAAFGCDARREGDTLVAGGPPTRGAELDLADTPDLAPVLAIVAAAAALRTGEPSRLTGLGTLRGKESDRLQGLAEGLSRAGLAVEEEPAALSIAPGGRSSGRTLELFAAGDHRMAFAWALLGLLRAGVRVRGSDCVAKSWPGFWRDFAALGAG